MNNVACTICQSQQHLNLDCPQQTCTLCGVVGHHALYCNPASEGHHTLSESSPPGVRGPSRDHLRHQQDPELQQQQDLAHFLERQPDATPDQQQEFLQHLELQRAQDEQDRLSRQDLQQVRGAGGGPGHVTAQVQAAPTDGTRQARTTEQQEHLQNVELQREQDLAQRRQQHPPHEGQQRHDPHQPGGPEGQADQTPAAPHAKPPGGAR